MDKLDQRTSTSTSCCGNVVSGSSILYQQNPFQNLAVFVENENIGIHNKVAYKMTIEFIIIHIYRLLVDL